MFTDILCDFALSFLTQRDSRSTDARSLLSGREDEEGAAGSPAHSPASESGDHRTDVLPWPWPGEVPGRFGARSRRESSLPPRLRPCCYPRPPRAVHALGAPGRTSRNRPRRLPGAAPGTLEDSRRRRRCRAVAVTPGQAPGPPPLLQGIPFRLHPPGPTGPSPPEAGPRPPPAPAPPRAAPRGESPGPDPSPRRPAPAPDAGGDGDWAAARGRVWGGEARRPLSVPAPAPLPPPSAPAPRRPGSALSPRRLLLPPRADPLPSLPPSPPPLLSPPSSSSSFPELPADPERGLRGGVSGSPGLGEAAGSEAPRRGG